MRYYRLRKRCVAYDGNVYPPNTLCYSTVKNEVYIIGTDVLIWRLGSIIEDCFEEIKPAKLLRIIVE